MFNVRLSIRLTTSLFQGFVPEVEGARLKGSDDMRFKGMIPGHVSNIFAPHDRASQPRYYYNSDEYFISFM